MSEQQSTVDKKTCVACFNLIHQRATKCPHCQSYQGLRRLAVGAGVIGVGAGLILFIGVALLIEFGTARTLFQSNDDVNYADQVTLQSSQLFLSPARRYQSEHGKTVTVVGRITNASRKVLGSIRLHVDVQNVDSQLIDSFLGHVYGPIDPGESITFRIDSDNAIHLPESDYSTHRVTVRLATADK